MPTTHLKLPRKLESDYELFHPNANWLMFRLKTASNSSLIPYHQICRFCWNKLRTEGNGLCPACRQVNLSSLFGCELTFDKFTPAGLQRKPSGLQTADHGGDGSDQGREAAEGSGLRDSLALRYQAFMLVFFYRQKS